MSNQPGGEKEETFEDYMRNARNEFVESIISREWNTEMRTAADDILIAYDQMKEKILSSPAKVEGDAVEFANFIGDRPIPEYSKSTNMWRWWNNEKRDYEFATTEQLYTEYLKQQSK
jgi:hypothetical protein